MADFPEPGDEVAIVFSSEIPARIAKYVRMCRASAIFLARKMFFGGEGLPSAIDDAIEHIMAENNQLLQEGGYEWHISISIERRFDIDDNLVLHPPSRYTWLTYHSYDLPNIKEFNIKVKEQLNSLETYISFLFGSHYIENLIVHQSLILDEQDEFVFQMPIHSGSTSLGTQYSEKMLPSGRFEELLEEFRRRRQTVNRFKEVMRLRTLYIREKDELKKFFYGFWSLEVLINSVSSRARTQTEKFVKENQACNSYLVVDLIKSLDKANIQDKFKVMQCALNCQDAEEDFRIFKKISDTRNNLAHGKLSDVESSIPEVERMLNKYLARALEINELPEIEISFDR